MQGQVLGFSGSEGAITGDDGKRYKFTRDEWKAERDPRAGERIDFIESEDGKASEIYPLKAGAGGGDFGSVLQSGSEGLSRLAQGEGAQDIIARAKAQPALVIAGLVLITCLFLTYIAMEFDGDESTASLLAYVFGGTAELSELAEYASDRAENAWMMRESDRDTLRIVSMMLYVTVWLGFPLLMVPAGALWTFYRAYKGQSTRRSELLTVIGIGWSVLYFIVSEFILVSQMERMTNERTAEAVGEGWSLGLGGYVLIALGIATIANMAGKLSQKAAVAEPVASE